MAQPTSRIFTVRRREPELITPAMATPHEYKLLSDIDDQQSLRFQLKTVVFYEKNEHMMKMDPVKVIREALAKTLVFYYPFAGRLREVTGRKLMVECTGEGLMFIEADADVGIEHFGDPLQPPFPGWEELLCDVPGSDGILDCPLMRFQATRLKCGGLILALRLNHTMCDMEGFFQFLIAVSEIARGAHAPSVLPVWQRELLSARNSLQVTYPHHEYDLTSETIVDMTPEIKDNGYFFFGSNEIHKIRRKLPNHLQKCSTFEAVIACLWKCRTRALQLNPEEIVRTICLVNARSKFDPPLPVGYYGNVLASPVALATAGEICQNSIGYGVELIRKAKADVTEEYMRSVADLMVMKGRPYIIPVNTFLVSDARHGYGDMNFGWGKASYAGLLPSLTSFYTPSTNKNGENGFVVSMFLPDFIMESFLMELDSVLKENDRMVLGETSPYVKSAL